MGPWFTLQKDIPENLLDLKKVGAAITSRKRAGESQMLPQEWDIVWGNCRQKKSKHHCWKTELYKEHL